MFESNYNAEAVDLISSIYSKVKDTIARRLEEFKNLWAEGNDERIFAEMSFCLLTPQSKAKVCWKAVENLMSSGVLFTGTPDEILPFLKGVRFPDRKAVYIVEARKMFTKDGVLKIRDFISRFDETFELRNWLVENVKGLGYKESSHFLRNIGKGGDLAILDRHILKNLKLLNVIDEIPKSLTAKRYLDIESKMREFSRFIGIPMSHLDLLLWYKEAGEVFK